MNQFKIFLSIIFSLILLSIFLILVSISQSAKANSENLGKELFFKKSFNQVLVLKVEGEIHSGESGPNSTGADTILASLREVENEESIKAILIEVNSPGGTVGASQEIYEELMYLRKEKNKKIVISMKDLAASGGYYIASAADYIFTEAGTITGSIGVIMMSPNISGLLKKYSVEMRVFKAGKYKDTLSMFKSVSKEEDEIIRGLLNDTYFRFISDVAKGRNLDKNLVSKLAEGKIYSGEGAVKVKLADEIGGRREALLKLEDLTGTKLDIIENKKFHFGKILEQISGSIQTKLKPNIYLDLKKFPILVILPSAVNLNLVAE